MNVFVTGATGLVGSRLIPTLLARGDRVLALSRKPLPPDRFGPGCEGVVGDPAAPGPWVDRVRECDAVVHLAGENVSARRWTDDFLRTLRESRVRSTAVLADALAAHPRRADGSAKVWVSASATGYYGPRGDEELGEDDRPGTDFLADLCVAWEAAAGPAVAAGVRVAHPRIGVVLDPSGGPLPKMARPFRLFAGGPIGTGRQWVSWVHHTDLVGLLVFALDTPAVVGPFNAVAPDPVRNVDLARGLGKALGRPYWLPTPGWVVRLAVGRMATLVTTGQRVVPRKAAGLGYSFRFPELRAALANIFA